MKRLLTSERSCIYQRPFEHGPIGLDSNVVLEGQVDTPESRTRNPRLNLEAVTPGYFAAMSNPLLRGRLFDSRDNEDSLPVVIVSEAMANRVWPGEDPIGKRLRTANAGVDGRPAPGQTVVGVVATARYREIEVPRLDLYVPFRQSESNVQHFTVRTTNDALRIAPSIAAELSAFNKALTIGSVTTMENIVRRTQAPWRFNMVVFSMFGAVTLVLAAIGLFALVAYEIAQRSKEIALRIAVGAAPGRVVREMIMQGARPAAVGLGLGLLASLLIMRTLSSLLFEVTPTDPAAFAAAIALLGSIVLLATYAAARKAASVDPHEALKEA